MIYTKSLINSIERTKLKYFLEGEAVGYNHFQRRKLDLMMRCYESGVFHESQILSSSSQINMDIAKIIIKMFWMCAFDEYVFARNHIYTINKNTFEVKQNVYTNSFSFLYDLMGIEDEFYFLKFNCPFGLYKGNIDKLNLISFLNIDLPFRNHSISPEKAFSMFLGDIYTKSWMHCCYNPRFNPRGPLTELEECRPYCIDLLKKKTQSCRLQIMNNFNIFELSSRYLPDLLQNQYSKFRFQKFNIDNDKDIKSLLEKNIAMCPRRVNKFLDYAIFEKDISYYVYIWLNPLAKFDLEDLIERKDKIKILFSSLKALEKNRKIVKEYITNRMFITNYGIMLKGE